MIRALALTLTLIATANAFAAAEQGKFEQSKLFAGFQKPFISQGQYTLSDEQLVWHTKQPVVSELKIDASGVYERQSDGTYTQQANTGPYGALLPALLAQDTHALERYFSTEAVAPPAALAAQNDECVQLTPVTGELKSVFSHFISCAQQSQVRFIGLYEGNGTTTEIILTPDH